MFSITVNAHRNILSANFSIKCDLQNTKINNVKVTCTKSYFSVNMYRECKLLHDIRILTPENFFIPSSVFSVPNSHEKVELENDILTISRLCDRTSNVKRLMTENDFISESNFKKQIDISDNNSSYSTNTVEFNFRMQISNSDLISKCFSAPQIKPSFCDFFRANFNYYEPYDVFCTNCGTQISKYPVTFHRIVEYCDNNGDLSESWYCHKNVLTEVELQENTLYVKSTDISVHPIVSESFLIHQKDSGKTICNNCNSLLGTPQSGLQNFFAEAVIFKNFDLEPFDDEKYCRNIVVASLWSMFIKKSTYRLLFQSRAEDTNTVDDDPCLLMWIPPSKTAQFKLQSTLPAQPIQVDFSTQDVFRVQYFAAPYSSSQVQTWKKEFNVDFYLVGSIFLKTLKEILISSTEPRSDSDIDEDFSTGCLPCNFSELFLKSKGLDI